MSQKTPFLASAVALLLLSISGCADLKTDLPAPIAPGVMAHSDGWTDPSSPDFHGNAIAAAGWDMRSCKTCHGPTYAGGTVHVSCLRCHNKPAGPENCTTCHGGVNNAPPNALNGSTSTTYRGVGAHQRHLLDGGAVSSYALACTECHRVPPSVYVPGHVDTPGPAEVVMSGLAATPSNGLVPNPLYDPQTLSCANTYCHGNFRVRKESSPYQLWYSDTVMTGANYSPVWTKGSSDVACGTCHGLPPVGHRPYTLTQCAICHMGVVNSAGAIIDKSKHINGKINVFETERSY